MSIRFIFAAFAISLSVAGMACADETQEQKTAPTETLAKNARIVLAAIIKAADENQRLPQRGTPSARGPFRRTGDELTVYYVRIGAAAARRLPGEQAASAYLLALGIALDDSTLLRSNLLTRSLWRSVESNEARKQRLRVLGEPALHGRHDLAQHFSVSAALTAVMGAKAAESAGIVKELLDSRGGSGFSFADLSADFAGIAFARRLLAKPSRLADIEKSFRIGDYAISPRGLPEGMMAADFAKKYGSIKDERFQHMQKDIRKRIDALPGYRSPGSKQELNRQDAKKH
ncbi:MAG TPA: hypothetical protein VN688_33940 [Gemmataceae bacterium]|nr:hypothetical protein [Gemmataceae bacterium]